MLLALTIILTFISVCVSTYIICAYLKSERGKYPPFVPSFGAMKRISLTETQKILQETTKSLRIADLGSGDGRLLLPLAKKFPQHNFYGYEWSWILWHISSWRGKGLSNLHFSYQNFMKADLSNIDVVLCFLSNELSAELASKFQQELKPGTIIISSAFAIKELKIKKEISAKTYGFLPLKVYIYQI